MVEGDAWVWKFFAVAGFIWILIVFVGGYLPKGSGLTFALAAVVVIVFIAIMKEGK